VGCNDDAGTHTNLSSKKWVHENLFTGSISSSPPSPFSQRHFLGQVFRSRSRRDAAEENGGEENALAQKVALKEFAVLI
jgi:hypothetical protein